MVKSMSDIIGKRESDWSIPTLQNVEAEFLDVELTITELKFATGDYGEYVVITTDKGKLRTSSKVLLEQLHLAEDVIKKEPVKAVIEKPRDYYAFRGQ